MKVTGSSHSMRGIILRHIYRVLLMVVMILSVSACGGDLPAEPTQSPDVNEQAVQDDTTTAETGDGLSADVVASVNGVPITQVELDRAFARVAVNSAAADTDALSMQVLNTLIEQQVIAQAADRFGVVVTEADVTAEIDGLKSSLTNMSWDDWLVSNQYTEAELYDAVENSIVTNRVRDQVIAPLAGAVEHVHARHILVATEAEANAVLSRLSNGEDFEALAAEVSLDVTTRDFGGDLGWFIREELLDESLSERAFALGAGEIAEPVVTRLGYHVIQTLEKQDRTIEQERMPLLVENVFNRWLEDETVSATVVRNS